jgi:hypothetical protein
MLFSIIFLTSNSRPFAYLDPGTGSIIIQVIVAVLLGGGILLRTFWKKIFHKKSKPEETIAEPISEESSKGDQA